MGVARASNSQKRWVSAPGSNQSYRLTFSTGRRYLLQVTRATTASLALWPPYSLLKTGGVELPQRVNADVFPAPFSV
jgi:hypothetical protein